MAILFGTQADGETLPVQVNEFGQLVAQGIDGAPGQPGPPGPPGVGQLPPDPFEGAVLGWEDGALAWLGGSGTLPAGTYGPYSYADGVLVVNQTPGLVNGQQVYMSDITGNRAYYTPQSSAIIDVTQARVGLTGKQVQDETGTGAYNKYGSINSVFGQTGENSQSVDGW